jgi:hypothetical protein
MLTRSQSRAYATEITQPNTIEEPISPANDSSDDIETKTFKKDGKKKQTTEYTVESIRSY